MKMLQFRIHMPIILLSIIMLFTNASTGNNNGAVTVAAGISIPLRPSAVTDNYGIGPNIGFGLCYDPAKILEIEPRVIFNSFPHQDHESFKLFEIGADIKIYTQERRPERLATYLVIGPGMSYMSYSNGEELWGDKFDKESRTGTETDFGMSFGLGIEHPVVPGFGVFMDIRYAIDYGEYDVVTYLPIRFGLKFSSKRQGAGR